MNLGKVRLTYTGWYASGDDDSTDGDIKNFMSTDVDMFDSVVLFEGGYTDDNYFTERPYIQNKGMILNKLAADFQATDKTKVGGAVLYLMTAEDLANGEDTLGTEIDAYVSHKLYPNVEVALNAGYLFADNGMDNFAASGTSADNIFRYHYAGPLRLLRLPLIDCCVIFPAGPRARPFFSSPVPFARSFREPGLDPIRFQVDRRLALEAARYLRTGGVPDSRFRHPRPGGGCRRNRQGFQTSFRLRDHALE